MRNSVFLFAVLFLAAGCVADATEGKLYHQVDLHEDLWKDDATAVEQVFTIDADTITTLVCEKGSRIIIPAQAFVLEDDPAMPAQEAVELRIIEVTQPAEMLRYHLNTRDEGGQLLESAGMIYLEAYSRGERLQLKEGKKILLGFPEKKGFEKAALYSNTESAGGDMRWQKEEGFFDLQQAIRETYLPGEDAAKIRIIAAEKGAPHFSVQYGQADISDSISLLNEYPACHFFSTSTIDWLNIERQLETELSELQLNIAGFPANTLYYLLFEDMNSLLTGSRKEGEPAERNTVFEGLPLGQTATLLAIYNKEGLYYMARQEIRTEADQLIRLKAERMDKKEIVSYLKSLEKGVLTAMR